MLELVSLSDIVADSSFFALKWNFQMSLSSKIADRQTARHPNFLVYYSFELDESSPKMMKLHPFGLICSSYPGLQRWICDSGSDQNGHEGLLRDLNKFIEVERSVQTQKVLRRHTHIGRDFDEEMEQGGHP